MAKWRPWKNEEDKYLRDNQGKLSYEEMGKHLNRSASSVKHRYYRLDLKREFTVHVWTKQEKDVFNALYNPFAIAQSYTNIQNALPHKTRRQIQCRAATMGLTNGIKYWSKEHTNLVMEYWGEVSVKWIAQQVGRTVDAVCSRAERMGLAPISQLLPNLNIEQLAEATGKTPSTVLAWIKKHGLRARRSRLISHFWQVRVEDFWRWAEKHQDMLDTRNMSPLILGEEPKWMWEKRKQDRKRLINQDKPWTTLDEQLLMILYYNGRPWEEMADRFCRNKTAVQRRVFNILKNEKQEKEKKESERDTYLHGRWNQVAWKL